MKNPFTCSTSPSSRLAGVASLEPSRSASVNVAIDQNTGETKAVLAYLQNSMARDLHDSFPQEFQAVIMHLRVALETNSCADARHHVEQAIAAAQTGLTCVRALIRELRQNPAQSADPIAARRVGEVVSKAARGALQTHVVDFELVNQAADVAIRGDAALHLAMIVREAIHNALKHGKPSRISCRIFAAKNGVVLELRDNGRGFAKDIAASGFGLIGMQERADAIGASLRILSGRSKGCSVQLTLPNSSVTNAAANGNARASAMPNPVANRLPLAASTDTSLRESRPRSYSELNELQGLAQSA